MRRGVFFVFLICLFFSFGVVSASYVFEKNSSTIEKDYVENDFIRGKIKISVENEINPMLKGNFGGGMNVYDVFKKGGKVAGKDYTCSPVSCKESYSKADGDSGSLEKDISLSTQKKIYGFEITGQSVVIKDIKFEIDGSGEITCENQANIDYLNDNSTDYFNMKSSGIVCQSKNESYGCFSTSETGEEVLLKKTPEFYCENVTLDSAPGYELGAKISGTGGEVELKLLNINKTYIGGCVDSPAGGRAKCIIDAPSREKKNYYVCIASKEDSSYKIKRENKGSVCGGVYDGSSIKFPYDYEIYARPLEYAQIGAEIIDKDKYKALTGKDIIAETNKYINDNYRGDCSNGCAIPLGVWGIQGQSLRIKNIQARYDSAGATVESDKIFSLVKKDFSLSFNSTFLDLVNFEIKTPMKNGVSKFELYLGENKLMEENINVKIGFNFSIGPRRTLIGQSTRFSIFGLSNIQSSRWNFGDGSPSVSGKEYAEHTYSKDGEYIVEVNVQNNAGDVSTKKFKVNVGDVKRSANIKILSYDSALKSIKEDIASVPGWVKVEIEKATKIGDLETSLKKIKEEYALLGNNSKEEEYVPVLEKLLDLEIPYSVSVSEQGTLPMDIGYSNIDSKYVAEFSGGEKTEDLEEAIVLWNLDSYANDVDFKTYSSFSEFGEKTLAREYKVRIEKISDNFAEEYLFIQESFDKLKWKEDYDAREIAGGSYIPIADKKEIEFLIVGESPPDVEKLGMYISPVIGDLGSFDKPIDSIFYRDGVFRWKFFFVWMSVLIVSFLAVYLILQTWYKRHYERSLFKNPDDLYNLIYFIYNSRMAGIEDKDSKIKLGERKWKKEQIVYAFKKIDGKRTGMWEIPIFKFMENKKVKQEIEKKQGKPIDVRFIKR